MKKTLRVPLVPSPAPLFPGQLMLPPEVTPELERRLAYAQRRRSLIGVVWLPEPHGHEFAEIGTLASFLDADTEWSQALDEPILTGIARFRLGQLHYDHEVIEATVRLWPWVERPTPAWQLVDRVGDYLQRYTRAFSELMPPAIFPDVLPVGQATLGVLSAAALDLPPEEKQRLLELETARELLDAVLVHLRLHAPMAERLAEMVPQTFEYHPSLLLN